jgi:predicted O-methyltransferase YrrM/ketosteroid isomerase-like protein
MKLHSAIFTCALALFPVTVFAGDLEDLQAAQNGWVEAFNRHDDAALAAALHENYTEFGSAADDASDWTARPAGDRRRTFTENFARYERWTIQILGQQYQVAGNTGIVSGTEKAARVPKGGVLEHPRTRFTNTWLKSGGRWLLLAAHRSSPPATAPPAAPLAANESEQRILAATLGGPRWANVPVADARVLRLLAESMNAQNVVELGTSTGYSALWIANALARTGGKLTTFEIDPGRARVARERFQSAGVEHIVTLVEGNAHAKLAGIQGPIDMVFIDAEKDGYPDYLRRLLPLLRPGGIIVAHNMRYPAPSQEFVKAVTTDPKLETVFVNMDDQGMAITLKKR